MSIAIPCDTVARLSALINRDSDPLFQVMRLDHGKVIVTDRKFMAVEQIAPFDGVFHISLPVALIEQCHTESKFSSTLTVTPNPMLNWTVARTTMGFDVTENLHVGGDTSLYDNWWNIIVKPCLEPSTTSNGALVCHADDVARLAATSPSGTVVFESVIDTNRPTMLRDAYSHDWVGFFHPRVGDAVHHSAATVPSWLRSNGL